MAPSPRARLFAPGERVGWIFRDRRQFLRDFPEPPPPLPTVNAEVLDRRDDAEADLRGRLALALGIGVGTSIVAGLPVVLFTRDIGGDWRIAAVLAALPLAMGLFAAGLAVHRRKAAARAVDEHRSAVFAAYADARAGWTRRRNAFDAREYEEVEVLDEWGAARFSPGIRRFDVFGGTMRGWQGLLTIFGSSMLVERRPVTVLDLSREEVSAELLNVAAESGRSVRADSLPADLPRSDLLAGLDPAQLVDVLAEAMHRGTTADRAERSMDHRLLSEVCRALGDDVSVGRLVAALRVLMREPDDSGLLRPEERDRVADELFSDAYRRDAQPHLRRIESYLHPLRTLGRARERAAA